jgi:quercetin dioxygenase-like cupin family protein
MNDIVNHKPLTVREKTFVIESGLLQLPQLEMKLNHFFSDGVYARELFIPKDAIVVGQLHKYQQLNIMIEGEMSVMIDEQMVRIKAPFIVVSPSGTKRIAYANEDTRWVTILRTDETDIAKIEEIFVAKTEKEYLEFCEQQKALPLFEET